jgi:hypothetical protein
MRFVLPPEAMLLCYITSSDVSLSFPLAGAERHWHYRVQLRQPYGPGGWHITVGCCCVSIAMARVTMLAG